MTLNPWQEYTQNFRDNLPAGITYREDIARYVFNGRRFVHPNDVLWYKTYLEKFGFGDTLATLLSTLSPGAAQLIAHPLEYGSMFQDRAGTTPVTESGQLVGHVLDAGSGGFHATAVSDAARGVFHDDGHIRWIVYNGVNTAYQTPVLPAPGVDKVQVFSASRKRITDSNGTLVETNNTASALGSFLLTYPTTSTLGFFRSRGSGAFRNSGQIVNKPAPSTAVLTGIGSISPAIADLRVDGASVGENSTGQGSGNYNPNGDYRLSLGARLGSSNFFDGLHFATLGPIVRLSAEPATEAQIEAAEAYYTAGTDL